MCLIFPVSFFKFRLIFTEIHDNIFFSMARNLKGTNEIVENVNQDVIKLYSKHI